jgi:hypothetical protein
VVGVGGRGWGFLGSSLDRQSTLFLVSFFLEFPNFLSSERVFSTRFAFFLQTSGVKFGSFRAKIVPFDGLFSET